MEQTNFNPVKQQSNWGLKLWLRIVIAILAIISPSVIISKLLGQTEEGFYGAAALLPWFIIGVFISVVICVTITNKIFSTIASAAVIWRKFMFFVGALAVVTVLAWFAVGLPVIHNAIFRMIAPDLQRTGEMPK